MSAPVTPPGAAARRVRLVLLALGALAAIAFGCGRRGDPLPPLRYVPNVTTDLSVRQQGELVTLELGYPLTTASGLALPGLHAVEVWSLASDQPAATARTVDARAYAGAASRRASIEGAELESAVFGDRLRLRLPFSTLAGGEPLGGGSLVLGVRAVSSTAETSDFSNLAALDVRTTSGAPTDLSAVAQAEGIALAWSHVDAGEGFTVYRRAARERGYGAPIGRTADDELRYLDRDARYGESYFYTVRTIVGSEPLVESEAAVEREIDYRDTFAPAPPARLTVLAEEQRVRVLLEASPANDVVGYVLYRRDPGAQFRRVTREPLTELEHIDTGLASALTYVYRATAVDSAGNEGEPGAEVTVTVR
jgi:hypothetical protein